eukprot:179763-Prorocentrum_lima.AAC.1
MVALTHSEWSVSCGVSQRSIGAPPHRSDEPGKGGEPLTAIALATRRPVHLHPLLSCVDWLQ